VGNIGKSYWVIIAIMLLGYDSGRALNADSKVFMHLNTKDGLSHGSTTCLLQDNEGFVWIGSYNGLNRYDAYEFKTFRFSKNDSTSLSQNTIQCLHQDRQGDVWVGTNYGLNRYNRETEKFKRFVFTDSSASTQNAIFSIDSDEHGNIWCGTWGSGIFSVNLETEKVDWVDLSIFPGLSKRSNLVRKVHYGSQGKIWICTWGDGVLIYDPLTKQVDKIGHAQIWDILEYSPGYFYVSTTGGGVFEFHTNDPVFREVDTKLSEHLGQTDVARLKKGPHGRIWIATYGTGLYIYSPKNKTFEVHRYELKRRSSISNNRISDVLFSAKQNMTWISSADGISIIDPNYKKFNLVGREDFPEGVESSDARAFTIDETGTLLIGTRINGILAYDYKKKSFHENYCPYQYPDISDNHVLSLLRIENQLLVATRHGFNIINFQTNRIKHVKANYQIPEGHLSNQYVRDLYMDKRGDLWLGTDAGLEHSKAGSAGFTLYQPYRTANPESLENLVWTIAADQDSNIWVGTDGGGLCRFNITQKRFVDYYIYEANNPKALTDNRIVSLLIDSQQRLWVGTASGLNLLQADDGTFRSLTQEGDGLKSDVVFAIEEDNNGMIWFSTASTLVSLDPNTWQYVEYDHTDGIQDKEFYKEASLKLPDGSLVFGGLGGFNYFHPDSLILNAYQPPVVLTDLAIFNRSAEQYQMDNGRPLLSKAINQTDTLHLSYKDNSFTLKFSALNYSLPSKNRFKYKLENFDDAWIDNAFAHTAAYTNLSPGKYIFKVKAANNDGVWNPTPKIIHIIISPPYYKTIWFKIIIVLCAIAVLFGIYLRRIYLWKKQKKKLQHLVEVQTSDLKLANNVLEERKEEIQAQNEEIIAQKEELYIHKNHLEKLVDERTRDLKEAKLKAEESDRLKSSFLANISHEIRTPMNAIVGFTSILEAGVVEGDEQQEYLKYVSENCNVLLRLIDDILDLSKIEAGVIEINWNNFNPYELIHNLVNQYQTTLDKPGIEIYVMDTPGDVTQQLRSDPLRLKQVLVNLIDNAIKFTDKGHVAIGLTMIKRNEEDYYLFQVQDTGIGIAEEQQAGIFNSFIKLSVSGKRLYDGTGLGLTICKQIIGLLGGEIWVESQLGKSSTFYFTIPVNPM